jgi:hypothetical protein
MNMLRRLCADESAFIISAELILLATIVVLGLVVGLTVVRDTITTELADTASGFGQINQSFSVGGATGHASSSAGSFFNDLADFGDNTSSSSTGGVTFIPATPETQSGT